MKKILQNTSNKIIPLKNDQILAAPNQCRLITQIWYNSYKYYIFNPDDIIDNNNKKIINKWHIYIDIDQEYIYMN